jgi:hypothetical protein
LGKWWRDSKSSVSGAFNAFATDVLHLPGVRQIKGQKRLKVYGDAFVRFLRDYPCIQASMAPAQLEVEISNYFPDAAIYKASVGQNVWDVFFLDPAVQPEVLVMAAIVLG